MTLSSNTIAATVAASLFAVPVLAETANFDFTGFNQISLSAGLEVDIVSGPEFSIVAEARNSRVLRKLEIEMRGHTLYATKNTNLRDVLFGGDTDISLTITLPVLHEITISSGVEAHVSGQFAGEFSGSASSGAALEIEGLNADTIDMSASSGANIDVTGSCRFLDISTSSGAEIGAEGLICEAVDVSSSSGASAAVFASEVLDSNASSGGSVKVYGSPSQTDISDSSGGSTKMRN